MPNCRRTPWTSDIEKIEYRVPLLANVLAKAGMTAAQEVKVVACDNFVSDIRMDEIRSYNPSLAVERRCNEKDKAGSLSRPDQDFSSISMGRERPHLHCLALRPVARFIRARKKLDPGVFPGHPAPTQ